MKSLLVGLGALALVASIPMMIGNSAAQSPGSYAGIKALSAEQIADLRTGRGMSFALAAELNGCPGPRHVLKLAEQLGLTDRLPAAQMQNYSRLRGYAGEGSGIQHRPNH